MDADRRRHAEELFHAASAKSASDREAFLRFECGSDFELFNRVKVLLAAADRVDTTFLSPASAILETAGGDAAPPAEAPLSLEDVAAGVPDRYRLEQIAGTGAIGAVYAATDSVLQRRVAIKVLDVGAASRATETVNQRVLQEARAMAALRHPNLCPVYEVDLKSPRPFIVMQWIDGSDLTRAWRSLDLHARLALFVKVVEAAAHMHAQGAVHADLKPGNVLVDSTGEPIIVDFGLTRASGGSARDGSIVGGTPGYAPLEQFQAGRSIGPESDVFALGAMLYELLTDRTPYEATTLTELLRVMQNESPALPEVFAPAAPWPLQRICLMALERDPTRRYPEAGAMLADLNRYLRGETVAARPSTLTGQFLEKVDLQIRDAESWRKQGLITESEADRLNRVLTSIVRPESHWILDSRRLSASQVTIYLGGWFALIAVSIGLVLTGDYAEKFGSDALAAWPWVRPIVAVVVAIAMTIAGAWLHRRGDLRIALGYLITGCLATPVAAWLLLRESLWLHAPMQTMSSTGYAMTHECLPLLVGMETWPDSGLANRQVFLITLAWFLCSVALRRFSTSSAFTPFAALACAATAVAGWASLGMLSEERQHYGLLGLFLVVVGCAAVPLGLRINRREEATIQQIGLSRLRTHDAWPVLAVAIGLTVIGLTLAAYNVADWYTLRLAGRHDELSTRAIALIMNGLVLQCIAHLLSRRRTVVRTGLAKFLRWLTPSHVLGGLLVLQIDADGAMWAFWLAVLGAASIAICYLSVWKQWRPFLFSGLFYVAIGYSRAFFESFEQLSDQQTVFNTVRLILTVGMLVCGIAAMIVAIRIPSWRAVGRLRRWREQRGTE